MNFFAQQLLRLAPNYEVKITANKARLRCPFHAGGRERTPSLFVSLAGKYAGSFCCFGCPSVNGKHFGGGWNKLAQKLNLQLLNNGSNSDTEFISVAQDLDTKELVEDEATPTAARVQVQRAPLFPTQTRWRGINSWLLREVGAKLIFNEFGQQVYLPIYMRDKWISGIYCSWKKQKISYINESNTPIEQVLYPYDYVVKKLKELPQRRRVVMLAEGPRDALHPLQNNILTLSVLGGAWSKYKLDALLDLEPTLVVLAFDPDKVGTKLTKMVKSDLQKNFIRCCRFAMQYNETRGIKEDPGSLSENRILYLKRQIKHRLNAPN